MMDKASKKLVQGLSASVAHVAAGSSPGNTAAVLLSASKEVGSEVLKQGVEVAKKTGGKAIELASKHPVAAACVTASLVAVAAPQLVAAAALNVLGFGVSAGGGVGAATVASGIQSGIGNVVAQSAFATCQSAGAGGAGLAVVEGVVQAVGGLGATAAAVGGYFWSKK